MNEILNQNIWLNSHIIGGEKKELLLNSSLSGKGINKIQDLQPDKECLLQLGANKE